MPYWATHPLTPAAARFSLIAPGCAYTDTDTQNRNEGYCLFGKRHQFHTYIVKKSTLVRMMSVLGVLLSVVTLATMAKPLGNTISTAILHKSLASALPPIKTISDADVETHTTTLKNIAEFVRGFDPDIPQTVAAQSIPMFRQFLLRDASAVDRGNAADAVPPLQSEPPPPPEDRLPIAESNTPSVNLTLRNETTYLPDVPALLSRPLSFDLSGKGPHVLIIHTHASESYTPTEQNYYSPTDPSRTEDTAFNMVRVGEELKKELECHGVSTIHDRGIHDYPTYNKSYTKTLSVIEQYLHQYPSIQMVFDIHRDAVVKQDGTKIKFTCDIQGEKAAQVMLVCGTNQGGLPNDNWQENLSFALHIQSNLESLYPGFARPLNLRKERFNMHATTGSLIFEVGTNGNTLEEALVSAKYLAKAIARALGK